VLLRFAFVQTHEPEASAGEVSVDIDGLEAGDVLLVPAGTSTPYETVTSTQIDGGRVVDVLIEADLGLAASVVEADGGRLRIVHGWDVSEPGMGYPEAAFSPRTNRHSSAADELAAASRDVARDAGGGRRAIEALVAEAEARFAYAHPEHAFNEGSDAVPYLACGTTPGSCVDINTYLVASLRAAGIETAYVYGYFFPAERGGVTYDMHCWVVTRCDGEILEWDIAHHMKAGLGPTRPALDPRPGRRIALGHSMGHRYVGQSRVAEVKLLAQPLLECGGDWTWIDITATLREPVRQTT
jgi:transglutaminase-like putative cysteine protease